MCLPIRPAAFVAVCVSLVIGSGTSAAASNDPPIAPAAVRTMSFEEPSWAGFRFSVDGEQDTVTFRMVVEGDAKKMHLALHFKAGDGGDSALVTVRCYPGAGARVDTQELETLVDHEIDLSCSIQRASVRLSVSGFDPGTYELVAIVSWRGSLTGEFRFVGTNGIGLDASASGQEVLLAEDSDFRGTVNAQAQAWVAGAQAIAGGELDLHVEGRLFGWFLAGWSRSTVSGYDPPDGERVYTDREEFFGAPSGDYRLFVDSKVDADLFCCDVMLLVADIKWP